MQPSIEPYSLLDKPAVVPGGKIGIRSTPRIDPINQDSGVPEYFHGIPCRVLLFFSVPWTFFVFIHFIKS
jgi:hypothetical protein